MESNFTSFIGKKYFGCISQNRYQDISKHIFSAEGKEISLPINYRKQISISTKEIIQLEAHSNYTLFYFANGNTLLAAKTMKNYVDYLDEYFIRIHNKIIINLRYLYEYDLTDIQFVILKDGKKRFISRRRKKEFREKTVNIFGEIEIY